MEILRASASRQISESFLITDYRPLIPESDRSPLHDVRQRVRSATNRERARTNFSTNELGTERLKLRRQPSRLEVWWSQTGSNRRPPACKAGALPTELWPHQQSVSAIGNLITGLITD